MGCGRSQPVTATGSPAPANNNTTSPITGNCISVPAAKITGNGTTTSAYIMPVNHVGATGDITDSMFVTVTPDQMIVSFNICEINALTDSLLCGCIETQAGSPTTPTYLSALTGDTINDKMLYTIKPTNATFVVNAIYTLIFVNSTGLVSGKKLVGPDSDINSFKLTTSFWFATITIPENMGTGTYIISNDLLSIIPSPIYASVSTPTAISAPGTVEGTDITDYANNVVKLGTTVTFGIDNKITVAFNIREIRALSTPITLLIGEGVLGVGSQTPIMSYTLQGTNLIGYVVTKTKPLILNNFYEFVILSGTVSWMIGVKYTGPGLGEPVTILAFTNPDEEKMLEGYIESSRLLPNNYHPF